MPMNTAAVSIGSAETGAKAAATKGGLKSENARAANRTSHRSDFGVGDYSHVVQRVGVALADQPPCRIEGDVVLVRTLRASAVEALVVHVRYVPPRQHAGGDEGKQEHGERADNDAPGGEGTGERRERGV